MEIFDNQEAGFALKLMEFTERNRALVDAVEKLQRDHNVKGFHCFHHMFNVMVMTGLLSNVTGLSAQDQDNIAAAAILHDADHHGVPDTVLDEDGNSRNIQTALKKAKEISTQFDNYDWPVVLELIQSTQWPHQEMGETIASPILISVMRDSDVLSSLLLEGIGMVMDGLRHEMQTAHPDVDLGRGPAQLAKHIEFFRTYKPHSEAGQRFFDIRFKTAYYAWCGYLMARDGGNLQQYLDVMRD